MLLLQAIIHPDTGEKILMPFRMSGTVTRCGSFGGSGIEGLVMWSNIEVSFTLGTVMARQGSSGCLEKVTLSWALIKTSLPQWQRCSRGLWRRKHWFFWSILKAPFFFGDFEVLAREELGQRKRYQILPNIPILTFFDRLYPIWYTSGKTFCFVFFYIHFCNAKPVVVCFDNLFAVIFARFLSLCRLLASFSQIKHWCQLSSGR